MSHKTPARVARLLRGWEQGEGSTLPERLASAVAQLVHHGDLPPGASLPSERRLAEWLAVSRGTVTAAYVRLRADGYVQSRAGSGTRVLSVNGRPAEGATWNEARLSTFNRREPAEVDLSSGALTGLDGTAEIAMAALRERLPALVRGDGYDPHGMLDLRREIGAYYEALGAPTSPDRIAVTAGSQQALQVVADAYLAPGDTVVVEDPTYRGAIDVFRSHGARLVPIPVTGGGPDAAALERLVHRLKPRLVYLLPVAHNPTGYVISPRRAAAIASILETSETILVEDGSTADLVLDLPRPPTPVGAAIPEDRWIAIGSISKLFWGGLRLGWVRGSPGAVQRIVRIKAMADLGSSLVSQAIAIECLRRAGEARATRRRQLTERLGAVSDLLAEVAPEWSWERPRGGSALWLRISGTNTTRLAEMARRRGVSVVPGPVFSAVEGFTDHIRLPFWGDIDETALGVQRLVSTWRELTLREAAPRPI